MFNFKFLMEPNFIIILLLNVHLLYWYLENNIYVVYLFSKNLRFLASIRSWITFLNMTQFLIEYPIMPCHLLQVFPFYSFLIRDLCFVLNLTLLFIGRKSKIWSILFKLKKLVPFLLYFNDLIMQFSSHQKIH